MRYNVIINTLGIILRYISLIMIFPIIFAIAYKEYTAIAPFVTASLVSIALGVLFSLNKAQEKDIDSINKAEAMALAVFSWLFFTIICAIPYMFFKLGIVNSVFESISGISTTGATILTDFSLYPKTFFFYRSMTQWFGGMGIIVLFVAILPKFAVAGRQMFFAESPNPVEEKITPRIRHTASWLWAIYIGLTVIEIVLLKLCGLSFYDSICTSFSTLAAGGFSPNSQSIAGYHNNLVTIIVGIFCFLAGTNFILQYKVYIQRKFSAIYKSEEFITYIIITSIISLSIALILWLKGSTDFGQAMIDGFFQTSSLITSSGFASVDFAKWNFQAKLLLLLPMFIGASAISACGGIKITRWIFIFKYIKRELNKIIHPSGVYPIRIEGGIINPETAQQMMAFVIFYFATFAITTFLIGMIEQNTITALSGSITTLGNIGPGLNQTIGPMGSFNSLTTATKCILIFNMFVGRLEIIPFLAIFHKDLWIRR